MPAPRLRVYFGPETATNCADTYEKPAFDNRVTVPAAEVLELLADAIRSRRAWVTDFIDANEEMTISSDLHEVLLAYQHYRRPGA